MSAPLSGITGDSPSVTKLLVAGLALALPLTMVSVLPGKFAVLVLAGLAALTGFLMLTTTAGRVVPPLLYIGLLALVSVPVDKYFFFREHVGGWPGIRIAAADLCLLVLIPIAILGFFRGTVRNRIPWPVLLIYGALLFQYLVSAVGGSHPLLGLFEVASAGHALLLALVCAALFRREYITPILIILAAQVILHTTFATIQVATGRPIGFGLGSGPAELVTESLETGAARLRPAGLFDHPIVYANFLMITAPILAAGTIMSRSRLLRVLLAGSTLVALLGLGLTLSRGAWISSAAAAVVFGVLAWRYALITHRQLRVIVVLGLVAAMVVGIVLGPRIFERLTASQAGNLEVRFELNKIAMRMIADRPLVGVGTNSFIPSMEAYDPDDVMEYFPATVHNLYLLEAAEAGLPALFLVLTLMTAIVLTTRRRLAKAVDPANIWLAVAITAGLCGFAVSQLADFSHRIEPLRSILWVNVGLLFGALHAARVRPPTHTGKDHHAS